LPILAGERKVEERSGMGGDRTPATQRMDWGNKSESFGKKAPSPADDWPDVELDGNLEKAAAGYPESSEAPMTGDEDIPAMAEGEAMGAGNLVEAGNFGAVQSGNLLEAVAAATLANKAIHAEETAADLLEAQLERLPKEVREFLENELRVRHIGVGKKG